MSQDTRDSQEYAENLQPQVQGEEQKAVSGVNVPPQARRLTIDDLREELKPILTRSEAANLC